MNYRVEIKDRILVSLEQASQLTGIGVNKLRELGNEHTELIVMNGSKRLYKRKRLEDYLNDSYSI